jgi:hypothetical protein
MEIFPFSTFHVVRFTGISSALLMLCLFERGCRYELQSSCSTSHVLELWVWTTKSDSDRGFFFFFRYWGLNSGPRPWATPWAPFVKGFFQIGSCKLFAQAGFEPWSFWSLPP